MTLLGGLGTTLGPLLGALVIAILETYLSPFGGWVTVIRGSIFVVCVLVFRQGLAGELARLTGRSRASFDAAVRCRRPRCHRRRPSEPRVHLFDTAVAGAMEISAFDPDPARGLPPREIAWY